MEQHHPGKWQRVPKACLTLHRFGWQVVNDEARYAAFCYREQHCQPVRESQQQDTQEQRLDKLGSGWDAVVEGWGPNPTHQGHQHQHVARSYPSSAYDEYGRQGTGDQRVPNETWIFRHHPGACHPYRMLFHLCQTVPMNNGKAKLLVRVKRKCIPFVRGVEVKNWRVR